MIYYSLTNLFSLHNQRKTNNLKHRNQPHQNRIFTRPLRFEIEGFVVINVPPSLDQHFDIFPVHVRFFSSELPRLGSLPLFTSNTYKKDESIANRRLCFDEACLCQLVTLASELYTLYVTDES